jgi:hypothetical protein
MDFYNFSLPLIYFKSQEDLIQLNLSRYLELVTLSTILENKNKICFNSIEKNVIKNSHSIHKLKKITLSLNPNFLYLAESNENSMNLENFSYLVTAECDIQISQQDFITEQDSFSQIQEIKLLPSQLEEVLSQLNINTDKYGNLINSLNKNKKYFIIKI